MNRNAATDIGGVLFLVAAVVAVFIATDSPDAVIPDFTFEVETFNDVPNGVKAVNNSSGDSIKCVVVPEMADNRIVVSAHCPQRTVGDWSFYPVP